MYVLLSYALFALAGPVSSAPTDGYAVWQFFWGSIVAGVVVFGGVMVWALLTQGQQDEEKAHLRELKERRFTREELYPQG